MCVRLPALNSLSSELRVSVGLCNGIYGLNVLLLSVSLRRALDAIPRSPLRLSGEIEHAWFGSVAIADRPLFEILVQF